MNFSTKPVLYAITDEILTPDETIFNQVEIALKAGVQIVQYRDKTKKDIEVVDMCKKLRELCEKYGALFVVNDRVDVALHVNSHGLHVGREDTQINTVKKLYKGFIGASSYGDISLALKNKKLGADYVAFGSFFLSLTKPQSKVISFEILKKAQKLKIPIAVIGGINQSNIVQFSSYEVDMICAISAIFQGNIENNVRLLKEKINHFKKIKNA